LLTVQTGQADVQTYDLGTKCVCDVDRVRPVLGCLYSVLVYPEHQAHAADRVIFVVHQYNATRF